MSVRLRLGLTFALLIAVFLVPVRYAGGRLGELREMAVEGRRQHAAATLAVGTFRADLANFDSYQRAYLATLDARVGERADRAVRDLEAEIERLAGAGYADATRGLAAGVDSLGAASAGIDRRIRAGQVDDATRAFERLADLRADLESELEAVAGAIDRASAAEFARAEELSANAARTTIVATLAAVLLAVLVSAWTTGALTGPLTRLSSAASRVARGTFDSPESLPYDRQDEIGELSRSFRSMTGRLAELDRLKAEFMSVASHELKTPISVIQGYAELLEEEVPAEAERQRDIVDAIAEQADIMTRLISRLLDIGRLEAGTYRMDPETVAVEHLLKGLHESFDVLADERGIRFVTEVQDSAPETVLADPDMLRGEVLGNLVSNALRFTPQDGTVRVAVWMEGPEVVFEVSDTGPGIPDAQRPHIFDKYYEGDRTRSMGSGLGLAVAKEAIEAHGGRITLEPRGAEGPEGATFRVWLPASPPGDGAASGEDAPMS